MECKILRSAAHPCLTRMSVKGIDKFQCKIAVSNRGRMNKLNRVCVGERVRWRVSCTPVSLEEEFSAVKSKNISKDDECDSEHSVARPLSSQELKALHGDSERLKLLRKLSEANQLNRFLKRQLHVKEEDLVKFKNELAIMENEIQALVSFAEEIAKYSIPTGSRKLNGKYIQSHLLSRLKAVQEKMKEHIKDVEAVQSQEVTLFWCGVAESVHVMGSFDGWSEGEHLSPEYTGSYAAFSTKLMLRPGRYEIKFLVDGEWHLSPEYPTVGEGLMQNNLLIVE